eukprot:gene5375-26832_t
MSTTKIPQKPKQPASGYIRYTTEQFALMRSKEGGYNFKLSRAELSQKWSALNADVNAIDATGQTALMYAAEHQRYQQTVQVLIAANANIEAQDEDGCMWDKAETLLTMGADVEAADHEGYTPLMHAAMRPPEQEDSVGTRIVEVLIKHLANMQRTSNDGDTADALAMAHNNPDLANLIVELSIPKKQCSVCKVRKLEAEYSKSNWKKTGKDRKCKRCAEKAVSKSGHVCSDCGANRPTTDYTSMQLKKKAARKCVKCVETIKLRELEELEEKQKRVAKAKRAEERAAAKKAVESKRKVEEFMQQESLALAAEERERKEDAALQARQEREREERKSEQAEMITMRKELALLKKAEKRREQERQRKAAAAADIERKRAMKEKAERERIKEEEKNAANAAKATKLLADRNAAAAAEKLNEAAEASARATNSDFVFKVKPKQLDPRKAAEAQEAAVRLTQLLPPPPPKEPEGPRSPPPPYTREQEDQSTKGKGKGKEKGKAAATSAAEKESGGGGSDGGRGGGGGGGGGAAAAGSGGDGGQYTDPADKQFASYHQSKSRMSPRHASTGGGGGSVAAELNISPPSPPSAQKLATAAALPASTPSFSFAPPPPAVSKEKAGNSGGGDAAAAAAAPTFSFSGMGMGVPVSVAAPVFSFGGISNVPAPPSPAASTPLQKHQVQDTSGFEREGCDWIVSAPDGGFVLPSNSAPSTAPAGLVVAGEGAGGGSNSSCCWSYSAGTTPSDGPKHYTFIIPENFTLDPARLEVRFQEVLGSGSFATVRPAVAVKIFSATAGNHFDPKQERKVISELMTSAQVNSNPHIVRMVTTLTSRRPNTNVLQQLDCSSAVVSLMHDCWKDEPSQRPAFADIVVALANEE